MSASALRPPASSAIALYARPTPGFDARVAHAAALLQSAAVEHGGRIVFACSFGAEDMVLVDLIARQQLPIPIATLDTGRLHTQTLELVERTERHYGIDVERHAPEARAVIEFVRREGSDAMVRSIALRKACCALRKLQPLQRLLAGREVWITGLRREQSDARGEVPFRDAGDDGRTKLNPLADWSWADVWHYLAMHEVPYNPLHDAFMPSIGCEPCTRAIAVGEPFRAGRWWWENEAIKECGLHSGPHSAAAPAAVSRSETDGFVSAQAHIGAADVKAASAAGRSQNEPATETVS